MRPAAAAGAAWLLCGCGTSATGSSAGVPAGQPAGALVTVMAASSLRVAFADLASRFQAAHPGTKVQLVVAGSADLLAQLEQGAPGDVLATADAPTMARAESTNLIAGQPIDFATNGMTIVVPVGNPGGVQSLADLADPEVAVVLCAPQVPCGAAAQRIEQRSGIDIKPVSEENAAADVLGKVSSGEADAGIVYVTDARAVANRVGEVAIPPAQNASNTYPIAIVAGAEQPALASSFKDFVLGTTGQQVLADAGFGPA